MNRMCKSNIHKVYAEHNNTNIYATFQLHPPYDFWEEDFWIFLSEIYGCHGNQSKSMIWTKFIRFVEDYSRNMPVKLKISAVTQK